MKFGVVAVELGRVRQSKVLVTACLSVKVG